VNNFSWYKCSDSARHWSQDICPPISQIVLKNFIKISLIIKECPEEILIKLAIVLKISKSSWNTVVKSVESFFNRNRQADIEVTFNGQLTHEYVHSTNEQLFDKWEIFQLYHGKNNWLFNEMCFADYPLLFRGFSFRVQLRRVSIKYWIMLGKYLPFFSSVYLLFMLLW
jgi:hypothetical protein